MKGKVARKQLKSIRVSLELFSYLCKLQLLSIATHWIADGLTLRKSHISDPHCYTSASPHSGLAQALLEMGSQCHSDHRCHSYPLESLEWACQESNDQQHELL